jgi:hemoglobin
MHDILNENDIALLIDKFYEKVFHDPLIGPFFLEVLTIFREKHIPIMNKFWGSVLLGTDSYKGNPMLTHFILDKKNNLNKIHFDRWLELWEKTVNENFHGNKASEAIMRAKNIAAIMQHKIIQNRNFN